MPNIPDDYWKAIIESNPAYDATFLYAVKTTRIFCRPSCKSRVPKRENVHIFKNAYMALNKGFRPCKRCKPDGLVFPAEEWIGQISAWIDQNYSEHITLEVLADMFHGSPFHLQRLFKRVKGMSPAEYTQKVRLEKAVALLGEGRMSSAEIAATAGFKSMPYFITLFKKKIGCTPAVYRKKELGFDGEK